MALLNYVQGADACASPPLTPNIGLENKMVPMSSVTSFCYLIFVLIFVSILLSFLVSWMRRSYSTEMKDARRRSHYDNRECWLDTNRPRCECIIKKRRYKRRCTRVSHMVQLAEKVLPKGDTIPTCVSFMRQCLLYPIVSILQCLHDDNHVPGSYVAPVQVPRSKTNFVTSSRPMVMTGLSARRRVAMTWKVVQCLCMIVGVFTASFFVSCMRIGEASNPGPQPNKVRIMTANVPGLRNNVSHVACKHWDIAAFQESGISYKNIGQVNARCAEQGLRLLNGPIDDRAYGGVAILSKTRKVKEWRKGEEYFVKNNRWQVVEIHITKNKKIILVNVYGHSGANAKEDIKEQNEALLNEVFRMCEVYHTHDPVFIVGDLNTEWSASPALTDHEKKGWFDVMKIFNRQTNTFWSTDDDFVAGRGSRLDYIIASANAIKMVSEVEVGTIRNTGGHTELYIELNCEAYSRNIPKAKICKAFSPVRLAKIPVETLNNALTVVEEDRKLFRSIIQEGRTQDAYNLLNDIIDKYLASITGDEVTKHPTLLDRMIFLGKKRRRRMRWRVYSMLSRP